MKKRSIKKQFYMNPEEAEDLRKKASGACMPEARLIRFLIAGYSPPPAPDEKFYEAMELVRKLYERLELIESRIGARDPAAGKLIAEEAERWKTFRLAVEKRYLLPERNGNIWQ